MKEHIVLLAVSKESMSFCLEMQKNVLGNGIRAKIISVNGNVSACIKSLRLEWQPYYSVVGQKELETKNISVQSTFSKETYEFFVWISAHHALIKKYSPPHFSPSAREIPIVPSYLVKQKRAEWVSGSANLFQPALPSQPVAQSVVSSALVNDASKVSSMQLPAS